MSRYITPIDRLFQKSAYKKLRLTPGGFIYKGDQYSLQDIKHIFFSRVTTTQVVNLVKAGESNQACLILTLVSGKEIKLVFDEASSIIFGLNYDRKQEIYNLTQLYLHLANETFKSRLSTYIHQLETHGYFTIDHCKFYPDRRVLELRGKEFDLISYTLINIGGCIEIQKKQMGMLDKVKKEVSLSRPPQFNTQTDTDVVFTLLDHYFGLRWK